MGTITVESRRGWEFRIDDAQGVAAGRISKLTRGSVREVLAPTREYKLSLNENASAELLALALAAAVCIHPTLSDEELDALLRTSD